MNRVNAFFVRLFAFFFKEMAEVIRQPKLFITLILGPFLIMLLFGIGYRGTQPPLRTVFVAPYETTLSKAIAENVALVGSTIQYAGTVQTMDEMTAMLKSRSVDLGVVIPENAYEKIRQNQQAEFKVYNNEINPIQLNYLSYVAQIYVDELNRQVISKLAEQTQGDAQKVSGYIDKALEINARYKAQLQAGDQAGASASQAELRQNVSSLDQAIGATLAVLSTVDPGISTGGGQTASVQNDITTLKDSKSVAQDIPADKTDYSAEIANVDENEVVLKRLKANLSDFSAISPYLMTRIFISKNYSINAIDFTMMMYFTPVVIMLLLQHIMVTLAALSIVRERRSGTMELFRVSPIKAGEILVGKYMSYMVIGVFIAAVLGALVYYGLKVPMLGSWRDAALITLALLFSSLGYGFIISLMAGTESQAVQFSMISLLLSVFFGGLFLDFRNLVYPVKAISEVLPVTYGTQMLQDTMLRGLSFSLITMLKLLGIGVVTFIIALLMMRRKMATE